MIPLIAGAARYIGVSWVMNNAIGAGSVVSNMFNPQITSSPPIGQQGDFAGFISSGFIYTMQTLAPSNKDMQALDDYFESFGYNVQQFGAVKLNVRSTFTYIKTRDVQIKAANLETVNQLSAMLNAGIKFWVSEIGV